MNPHVQTAAVKSDYRLLLTFVNGEMRVFDLRPYLDKGVFKRLLDPTVFAQVCVVAGSVEWPGEVDLSYDTLYLRSTAVQDVVVA